MNIILVFWGLFGNIRNEFISSVDQDKWRLPVLFPQVPWYWLVLAFLVLTLIAVLEGSYRIHLMTVQNGERHLADTQKLLADARQPKFPQAKVAKVAELLIKLDAKEKVLLRELVFIGRSRGDLNVGQIVALEQIQIKTGFVSRTFAGNYEVSKESQPILEALFEQDDAHEPAQQQPPSREAPVQEPELEYAGIELVPAQSSRGFRNHDPWAMVRARFYYKPALGSNPVLSVKAHLFFSKDGQQVKQVFKGIWDEGEDHLNKCFNAAEAYELLICSVNEDGSALMTLEHHLERIRVASRHIEHLQPIKTWLTGSSFDIKVVLIGEAKQQVRITTETIFRITLKAEALPTIDMISHSLA